MLRRGENRSEKRSEFFFKDSGAGFQLDPVFFRETGERGTVQVKNTHDPSVDPERYHDLGIGSAVTGDMSRKAMDVRNKLRLARGERSAADATAGENLNTGDLALERP